MPEKYEREIDAILRRSAGPRRRKMVQMDFADRFLLIAIGASLLGGGWADAVRGGNVITGLIALVAAVCIALVALSSFPEKPPSSYPRLRR
jgi:hypothetical protein